MVFFIVEEGLLPTISTLDYMVEETRSTTRAILAIN